MTHYGARDVERTLGLSRPVIRSLVRAGFVTPQRGPRNAYVFSFRDLIVLKTARELTLARIPTRRIAQALKQLRRSLPTDAPLSGIRIQADGNHVVVREGERRWQADSGQYLLDFDVQPVSGGVTVVSVQSKTRHDSAEAQFQEACRLEAADLAAAREAYRRVLSIEPAHAPAAANLGRLLHLAGELEEAEQTYRAAIACCGNDPLLLFNFAVLLEDLKRPEAARELYEAAVAAEPHFADAHYNLGVLYETLGDHRRAIRHLKRYRELKR